MVWYKVWRESRTRFFIGVAVIVALCLINVLFKSRLMPELVHDRPYVHTYAQYIYWKVFGGQVRGLMQLLCLLLGLGGLQRDRKQGTLGFTLALPISRDHLTITRATVGFIQIVAIALLPSLLLWVTSPLVHEQFSLSHSLPFLPLWIIGGLATFSLSFLCSVIFQSEYTALAVAWVTYFFYLAAARYPRFRPYPLHMGDMMGGSLGHLIDLHTLTWTGTVPMAMLSGFVLASVLMLAAANAITTRQDL
jgi:ABC-2 type transport system permease protein